MFVAQAHSFANQARLAITLAWVAGYTNILTVITCGTVTSHISGTASYLGRDVAEGTWGLAALAAALIVAFYVGAALSGFCTELARRKAWESIYILPIALEGTLLLVFGVELFMRGGLGPERPIAQAFAIATAAMAMGLQNATITRISSGVVRTTHVTGVLTDLGLESAHFAFWAWDKRGSLPRHPMRALFRRLLRHPSSMRLALLGSIFGSFAFGAALGTWLHALNPRWSMLPPILFLGWIVLQDLLRPIAEIGPSDLMEPDAGLDIPPTLAIYHLRKRTARAGVRHRMPNLLGWASRLPESIRVVILDLGREAKLNSNAAMDIRAVISQMKAQGRRLIIAGLGEGERRQLAQATREELEPNDICVDVEMAFIHAMALASEGEEGSGRE